MEDELFKYLSQYITLTEEEAHQLIQLDLIKKYKKGTVLLKEGVVSNKSYFVLKGCLRTYYLVDGEEKTTAFYTEKQGISPQCCITGIASEYYLTCVEDCILCVSTTDMEQSFFEQFPRFESLCRVMAEQQLSEQQTSFDKYMHSSPEQRYVHLMETRADLIQRVPQYQLASYLGIKPESLSRIRKRLFNQKKS
ncbi:Crp/Fnr family transcriptional regulator [Aureispira anguillae]|uniref:Crp/Fnr family transcriptional regulator n=1 Tax=Aureispira anguillae TaxID=2864201 RepID=A0A916DTI8_9BACT|nr:Crp/Fnr family transcriptional regulator [Aureispira anguillae]BDS12591.1 Crp/Fnr family transcriptional regulator [Aureispira anguillae]